MLPYLHILIRVESDGALHALGAFTSKEKQSAYQQATGLTDKQVRLDFYNGPFEQDIKVVYAGHRRWNMDRFQLGGYFPTEGEAWNHVTQEGYVSVLRIDTSYEDESLLKKEALERYAKLQKRWRLSSYEELVKREGADKARANVTLRFYEDALESFKPKTRRDARALYAFFALMLILPIAILSVLGKAPDYGENLLSVKWLPAEASNISFYRSKQVQVYEFSTSQKGFQEWAEAKGMKVKRLTTEEILSRYKAYLPVDELIEKNEEEPADEDVIADESLMWEKSIQAKVSEGLIARNEANVIALFDSKQSRVYYEEIIGF